jgi:transposase
MDQAPIHRGARVAEALQSMQDSQSIHVRFLPPYSPFLNPLEHCFLAIKSHVSSKEPTNRASVVAAINAAILDATTPQKSQLFFSHCQRLYPPCAEQQEITGPVLANPMAV